MKIAFFISTMGTGGAERTVAALANEFIKYDDEVFVITVSGEPSFYYLDSKVKHIKMNMTKNSRHFYDAIINNSKIIIEIRKILKNHKIDAMVTFNIATLTIGILAASFLKTKVIGTEMSNPFLSKTNKVWKFAKRNISVFAHGFVFQTKESSAYYREALIKKSIVIPNAIFVQYIPDENIKLSERKKEICAVGRLEKVKGFDLLIKAFSEFVKVQQEYILSIYGEGKERNSLQSIINDLHLTGKVFLHGKVSDIPQRIYKSYMFVLSSRYEGMPNALMEALACGIPCISTDCDFGPRELINHGENGLLVPVDDVEAIKIAMFKLVDDSNLAEKLSRNARNINNTHSFKNIAQKHYSYIQSIVRIKVK